MRNSIISKDLKMINVGIQKFYNALIAQNVKAVQVNWKPPKERDVKIDSILSKIIKN